MSVRRVLSRVVPPLCVVVAGCSDSLLVTRPSVPRQEVATPKHTVIRELSRFETQLSITGDLRPGGRVTITYVVTAKVATPRAHVSIDMPELHFTRRTGFTHTPLPLGERIQSEVSRQASLRSGEALTGSYTLTIPKAGYYRVVLVARDKDPASRARRTPEALFITDFASQEAWILITEDGGKVTSELEVRAVPPHLTANAGMFQPRATGGADAKPPADSRTEMCCGGPTFGIVKYYDYDTQQYVTVPGAKLTAKVYSNYYGTLTGQEYYFVADDNGFFDSNCPVDWEERWDVIVYLDDQYMDMGNGKIVGEGYSITNGDCGSTRDYLVASEWAHVYTVLKRVVIPNATSLFGRSRPKIGIFIKSNISSSRYRHFSGVLDEIEYKSGNVFGGHGQFTIAHEYGHAFHNRALGGIPEPVDLDGLCDGGHSFTSVENRKCAIVEGFADYFGQLTNPLSPYGSLTESNFYFIDAFDPGFDGSHVESAVMAFLHDVTDSGVEPHDNLSLPVSYVGDLMLTCMGSEGGPLISGDNLGIPAIVWCLEQGVDQAAQATYFPNMSLTGYYEGAAEPPGLSQNAIRAMWVRNLFDLAVGQPPGGGGGGAFTVTIQGPTTIWPHTAETWTASITNGTPPFTYAWYRDNVTDPMWNEPSFSASFYPSTQHEIAVEVVDANGATANASIWVYVNSGNCPPDDPNCQEYSRVTGGNASRPDVRAPGFPHAYARPSLVPSRRPTRIK
jgi:hypothetical protein